MTPSLCKIKRIFELWFGVASEEPYSRTQKEVKFLMEYFKPPTDANILDIGCGSGRHLRLLEKRGYKNLYGVDFSGSAIKKARMLGGNKSGIAYYCEELGRFSQTNNVSYDLAYSFDFTLSLYSARYLTKYLAGIRQGMNKSAYCLFEVWDPYAVRTRRRLDCNKVHHFDEGDLYYEGKFVPSSSQIIFSYRFVKKNGAMVNFPEQIQYVYDIGKLCDLAEKAHFTVLDVKKGMIGISRYCILQNGNHDGSS